MKIERLPKDFNEADDGLIGESLSQNIRKARMKVGLSQLELARMIGLETATAISLMESGDRSIRCIQLWKIAYITGEPVQNFFTNGII